MQSSGYILTGLRKYRNRSHAPIILDYGLQSDWFGIDEKASTFSNYESFDVRPATRNVLRCLAANKLSKRPRALSIDDFSVWAQSRGHNGIIICTEGDYLFAKTIAALTGRSRQAVQSINLNIANNFKRLFLTGGPAL